MSAAPLHLFEATGIELEYMIVHRDSLAVAPIADLLLQAEHGSFADVERGKVAWSNELVLHVIELKTNGPAPRLAGLDAAFAADVAHINNLLQAHNAQLMPTAMHPFFVPQSDTRLWPHDHNAVYEAFNRIFDCRGHGWSNLQSTHINLPFCGDAEFGALHAAIRLLLPVLPALAASSPLVEGKVAGVLDARLRFYRDNAKRLPRVTGQVIPEAVFTQQRYHDEILRPLYQDIAPHDAAGELQHEWLNARGAIARFDRGAIEIRTLDVQECPKADMAIAALTIAVLRAVAGERFAPLAATQAFAVAPLFRLWQACVTGGGAAVVNDAAYLRALGLPLARASVQELWHHLFETVGDDAAVAAYAAPLRAIVGHGPLAARMLRALGPHPSPGAQRALYGRLCACLAAGELFLP